MNILSVKNLEMRFGAEPVFEDLEFGIDAGENVALVGPNGVGKTTLLKIIAGEYVADDGDISIGKETRVAYLHQDEQFTEGDTAREVVAEAMADVRDAIADHEAISEKLSGAADLSQDRIDALLDEQHDLQERIEHLGGWQWEHRVEDMITRLGIDAWVDRDLDNLSGGQRRRTALARVLLEFPDLLLLDEPTNHLDPETVEWLENWLIEFPGAVFFISHDRYFLERVAGRILELDEYDGAFVHPPDYQTFMERKLRRMEIQKRTKNRRQKLIEQELDWLDSGMKSQGRDNRSKGDQLKSKAEQVQDLDYERDQVDMELHAEGDFSVKILAAQAVHKSYGGRKVLEDASMMVAHGNKIGLLGPNGCGKTTLLRIMLGQEKPDAGRVEIGEKTDAAFMTQDYANFDRDETIYDAFSASDYVWVGDQRHHKRDFLENFLFDRDDQKKKVSTLSGGQIRRLQLARVVGENANLVVLDEPTNDLDIASVQALEEALKGFGGCLIVVSHDRYFLNRVCNVIVAYEEGDWNRYEGNYDDYKQVRDARRKREQARREAERAEQKRLEEARRRSRPRSEREAEQQQEETPPDQKPLSYRERQELEGMEEQILEAEMRKEELEETLSDPELYAGDGDSERIQSLNAELREVESEIEQLYERWEELEARA